MNQNQLNKTLHYWQKRLRLLDWDVSIEFVPKVDEQDSVAQIFDSVENKSALIIILDPDKRPVQDEKKMSEPNAVSRYVVEPDLVHELLHIHMPWLEELIGDNTHLAKSKEQALTLIANALVELKYGE